MTSFDRLLPGVGITDRDAGARARRRLVTVACLLAATTAATADGQADRSGGLVPAPRKSREELMREWDLNSDGSIDKSEAEVAASRMRRERAMLRLNSGLDPVTGLPRGEQPLEPDRDEDPADEIPADDAPDPAPADERRLPGTRVPRSGLPENARGSQPAVSSGRATSGTSAAADRPRQTLTGGVRAGGLPARAGYGAGVPSAPLNAGLPIPPRPPGVPQQRPQPRGGLVPSSRPAAPPPRPTASRDMYDPY